MDPGPVMRYLRLFRSSTAFKAFLIALTVAGIVYQLLFSPWGNRLLYPALEKALSSAFSSPVTVEEFSLSPKRFDLLFRDAAGNTISTQGGYSLLTLRLYAHYRIECQSEQGFNPLGIPMKAEGSLSGGIAAFDIRGTLHAFEGDILYRIQLHRFRLASLHAELNRIGYAPFLAWLETPSATDTRIWGSIDLRGFDRRSVRGDIRLVAKTEHFEPTQILPDDEEPFDLRSLLADERGRIKPFDANVTLKASVEHAGIVEQFAGIHLEGPASVSATLEGDIRKMALDATLTAAGSDTALSLSLIDLEPHTLRFTVAHADLERLFGLFALNAPLAGRADADGVFTPDRGEVRLALSGARTLPAVLKSDYNITQPPLRFDADLTARTDTNGIRYRGHFVSDLRRLEFEDSTPHGEMLGELLKTFR